MTGKTDKRFLFELELNWLIDKTGILMAHDANGTIKVSTPPQFGGEGKPWTPEHLFLGAISSCFMTTYLSFANKMKFSINRLHCNIIGQIEIIEGKYKFTRIDVFPIVTVATEELKQKAGEAMEKTHKYCLISNSINAEIVYHSQVEVGSTPDETASGTVFASQLTP